MQWAIGGRLWIGALAVFDDGGGPALYIGGETLDKGPPHGIYKWDGSAWIALGSGMPGVVYAMKVHRDGSGSALYIAGSFFKAGGIPVNSIARWDGQIWSALGAGLQRNDPSSPLGRADVLESADLGQGPQLFVGGTFTSAGGVAARNIAAWSGQSWSALGAGLSTDIRAMQAFDDSTGPALYVGGGFDIAGGSAANHIARWDGQVWSPVGGGLDGLVNALGVFNNGQTNVLVASGYFSSPGAYIAQWDGADWLPLGSGLPWHAEFLGMFDYGTGPKLYAGGFFGSFTTNLRWLEGHTWISPPGGTHLPSPRTSLVYNDGVPALYVVTGWWGNPSGIARYGCEPEPDPCYANCDGSTLPPVLNVDDFTCFITEFASGITLPHAQQLGHYANCDASTIAPVLNVDDFTCFINAFAAGCP